MINRDLDKIEDIYPASYLQMGMFVENLLDDKRNTYHDVFCYSIQAKFEHTRFKSVWERLIDKHELLRAGFEFDEDRSCIVVVYKSISFDYKYYHSFDTQDLVVLEKGNEFDFTQPGLFRLLVNELEHTFHIIFSFHHAIADGWSVASLLTEFINLYTGKQQECNKISLRYGEYIRNEKAALQDAKLIEYWNDYTKKVLAYEGSFNFFKNQNNADVVVYSCQLNPMLSRQVLAFAKDNLVSVDCVFILAYGNFLKKILNTNEMMVGLVVNNRISKKYGDKLFGLFLNTIPFNLENIYKVDEVFQEKTKLYRYQMLPYGYIKSKLKRDCFKHVLNFVNFYNLNEQVAYIEGINGFEKTGITFLLNVQQKKHDFELAISADPNYIDYAYLIYLTKYYIKYLSDIVLNKKDDTLLTDDINKLLNWNQTEVEYPKHKSIHEIFEKQVRAKPEATAVIFKDQRVTYKELNSRANQLAHHLRKLGVTADTVVGIGVERSIEMIVGILGILKAGGAYLPLDPSYPVARLRYMLEDSKAKLLLIQESLRERFAGVGVKTISFEEEAEKIAMEVQDDLEVPINPLNLAYIIYTSGSTGQPKGVQIAHKSLVNRLSWMQEKYKLESQDRVLHKTPFSFDVAVWELFWPILEGSQLVIAPPEVHKDPIEISRLIEKYGITVIHFVPSMLNLFLNFNNNNESLKNIRVLVASGEPLTVKQHEQTEYKVNNLYGPTEATVDVSYYASDKQLNSLTVPIGCPISNTQLYVLDRGLNLLLIGVTGEIYIGGVGLARGYINRPDLTAERFIANPFNVGDRLYKTGDLGRFLPDGNIEFLGRIDNQVKIRGFRIELGEIEKVIGEYVREAVVLVKSDENDSKQLVAYIVPKEVEGFSSSSCFKSETGEEISVYEGEEAVALVERIRNELASKLPEYMVPSYFVVLSKLPLNLSGKTDSKILQRLDHGRILLEDEYVAPRNEIEGKLCKIWEEVLKVERVGINDNFFRIGGDSIIAIQMISKAKKEGLNFLVKDIFNFPMIKDLVEVVSEADEEVEYSSFSFELGNDSKQKIQVMLNKKML